MQHQWQKPNRCGEPIGGNCVEVDLSQSGGVFLRDSKLGDASPVHSFTDAEWDAFILSAKAGQYDRPKV